MFGSGVCKLLTLSDEVLLMIVQYLSTSDLISTSRTCQQLKRICLDKRLMMKIINPPEDYESMKLIFRHCMNPSTTVLSLSSRNYPSRGNRSSLPPSLLLSITPRYSYLNPDRTPRALTQLHIIRQTLDGKLFKKVTMFPHTLKVLELTGTHITDVKEETQWFRGMSDHFTKLETLTLKYCSWVTNHALLAISKCPELLSLDLEGCCHVGDSVPYTALAARNGFLKLKALNLNNTDLRDSDFESLRMISTLEELYVGKYHIIEDNNKGITARTLCYFDGYPNLRVMDISGSCQFRVNEVTPSMYGFLFLIANRCRKLEKLIACAMTRLPTSVLESFKTRFPSVEIYQELI